MESNINELAGTAWSAYGETVGVMHVAFRYYLKNQPLKTAVLNYRREYERKTITSFVKILNQFLRLFY